jgi:hypothetical protein
VKLPETITKEIATAPERCIVRKGARHIHVLVDARLVGILPLKGADNNTRAALNVRAQIRRALRGQP